MDDIGGRIYLYSVYGCVRHIWLMAVANSDVRLAKRRYFRDLKPLGLGLLKYHQTVRICQVADELNAMWFGLS